MPNDFIAALFAAILTITGGATATEQAVRGEQTQLIAPPPPAVSIYAPEGLDDCDEMNWYRRDAGLPDTFSRIGWRESNCRNEDGVRTSCCHGYWQMWTELHMRDHRIAPKMTACGVATFHDLNSDTPEDKKRQACAAKALYDTVGDSAWSATR
jgi:hypothetical protein